MSNDVHSALMAAHTQTLATGNGDFLLDEGVVSHLPEGAKIISAENYGRSTWAATFRLNVELANGTRKQFFIKCVAEEAGRAMAEGEFASMTELYNTMPSFVPKPIASGQLAKQDPPVYFFLCEFLDMIQPMPDPQRLCANLAELHRKSVSPTGKFGFQVRTCHGNTPQPTEWNSSWTRYFTRYMAKMMALELEANGPWEDLRKVENRTLSHVIPRLIGILEADGRNIKPCLIHADLWEGNTGTSPETGDVYVFDAGSYYAHNEMEIAMWRCPYNKMSDEIYANTYFEFYGIGDLPEELDDRSRLYSVYFEVSSFSRLLVSQTCSFHRCDHTSSQKATLQNQTWKLHLLSWTITYSNFASVDLLGQSHENMGRRRTTAVSFYMHSLSFLFAEPNPRAYENMSYLIDKYAPWPEPKDRPICHYSCIDRNGKINANKFWGAMYS